jgi:two-component system chemotaxis sensor kinase CheA
MNSDSSTELRAELLDDFYTECDELFSSARVSLAALETAAGTGQIDVPTVETTYRCIHTLKGNSAIVGLRPAEELAHAMEGLLRRLSRREIELDATGFDLLAAALLRLEQIITAHRLQETLPATRDLLARFEAQSEIVAGSTPLEAAGEEAAKSPAAGGKWRCIFVPSSELESRGITINQVRSRLSALGEIVSATPSVEPGRGIAFEFILALREAPTDVASFAADGLRLEPLAVAPAVAPAESDSSTSSLFIAPSHIVRVDLSRLDDLMRITGEMVIHRSRLEDRIAAVAGDQSGLQEVNLALGRAVRELREAITRVRLVPVAEIFARMPFVARDLARDTGKQVRLVLEGQHTEIDKYLVERLKEPLLHLVRNAISHGIEEPSERVAKGKPAEAIIRLRASTIGQAVSLQVQDDGRGIDAAKVLARAADAGLPVPASPTDHDLLSLICRPGFSTRDVADRASGRGVGMDVVHNTVRELGGSLSLENVPGKGARFTLRLPLTLSIAETFIVSAANQICAVPQGFVEEIIQIPEAQVRTIQDVEVISYRDGVLPLVRLRSMFRAERLPVAQVPVLVLSSERGLTGLVVDRVHGQREVVVRSIQDPLIQVPGVSGATELGDGRPVLILDATALTSGAVRPRTEPANVPAQPRKIS